MKGGTVFKQGNRWIWKSPPFKINGVEKKTRKSFKTREEAENQRNIFLNLLNENNNNYYIIGLTVKEAYKKWVDTEWSNEENISFNTQRGYRSIFNTHILPIIGDYPIDNLNVNPFITHLNDLARCKSQKTINNIKQALVILLNHCEKLGWIDINNSEKIKSPKAIKIPREKIVNTISEEDYNTVIKILYENNSMYAPIIEFLRNTGLRAEELCLTESDIQNFSALINKAIKRRVSNLGHSELIISKYLKSASSYRLVPLDGKAWDNIHEFRKFKEKNNIKSKYIFCTKTGGLIEQRNILRAFHGALKSAGLDQRGLHSLRKLFCKTLKDIPTDWEKVRIIMGHESVIVTQKYYYSIDEGDFAEMAFNLDDKTYYN